MVPWGSCDFPELAASGLAGWSGVARWSGVAWWSGVGGLEGFASGWWGLGDVVAVGVVELGQAGVGVDATSPGAFGVHLAVVLAAQQHEVLEVGEPADLIRDD